jgi:NAD(P)-dependent dehydrogenase (short-subunit alcohol dehydrogenase family)
MIARRRGRILNMASHAGLEAIAYVSAYVTSKTALIRFTENMAVETQEYGISAFAIVPGTVRTAMTDYLYNSEAAQKWLPWVQQFFDEGLDDPMEQVTRLVLALALGQADVLSGCTISIADDLTELVKQALTIKQEALHTLKMGRLPE